MDALADVIEYVLNDKTLKIADDVKTEFSGIFLYHLNHLEFEMYFKEFMTVHEREGRGLLFAIIGRVLNIMIDYELIEKVRELTAEEKAYIKPNDDLKLILAAAISCLESLILKRRSRKAGP